jgi:hypothetical protein
MSRSGALQIKHCIAACKASFLQPAIDFLMTFSAHGADPAALGFTARSGVVRLSVTKLPRPKIATVERQETLFAARNSPGCLTS